MSTAAITKEDNRIPDLLMRITGKNSCCGIVWQKKVVDLGKFRMVSCVYDVVVNCAPLVSYVKHQGWYIDQALRFFKRHGFNVEIMEV